MGAGDEFSTREDSGINRGRHDECFERRVGSGLYTSAILFINFRRFGSRCVTGLAIVKEQGMICAEDGVGSRLSNAAVTAVDPETATSTGSSRWPTINSGSGDVRLLLDDDMTTGK
jgi:hypothetical protein